MSGSIEQALQEQLQRSLELRDYRCLVLERYLDELAQRLAGDKPKGSAGLALAIEVLDRAAADYGSRIARTLGAFEQRLEPEEGLVGEAVRAVLQGIDCQGLAERDLPLPMIWLEMAKVRLHGAEQEGSR